MIPDADRMHAVREFEGQIAYLRVSCFVAPFFGDTKRRLLSPTYLSELRVVEEPGGKHLVPGQPEKILGAGTRVRISGMEFPTALVVSRRPRGTPRAHPWILLAAEGEPPDQPLVLVLGVGLRSYDEVIAETEKYLSPEPVGLAMASFSEPIRRAIAEKRIIPGMDATAAQMAWGYPERRTMRIIYDPKAVVPTESSREETWTYPSGTRQVIFVAGRVSRAEKP